MSPFVSVIITTWSEKTKPYLDLCIESVKNLNYPKDSLEIILVGRKSYQPQYEGVKTIAPDSDNFSNPVGINFGFKAANPNNKHFFYLNDDVVVTANSLKNLVEAAGDVPGLFNPISHDNQNSYWLGYPTKRPTLEDMQTFPIHYMNKDSCYPAGLFALEYICIFSTLITRSAWLAIGDWDENYQTSQDDVDYSLRAKAARIPKLGVLNALTYHFGGTTADHTMTDEKRKQSREYFIKKWNMAPP